MNINVKLIGLDDPSRENISLRLSESDETVGSVKEKIATKLNLPSSSIRLLFSGRFLSNDEQQIGDLGLGPATFLNALIADVASKDRNHDQNSNVDQQSSGAQRHWRSRFFVYCKNCEGLMPGKLRVRCSMCKSSAILVKNEPNSWDDILTRGSIHCECFENGCRVTEPLDSDRSFPTTEFYFKCAGCSNENGVVPLPQVKSLRGSRLEKECSICSVSSNDNLMIVFSCDDAHATCLDCFIAYSMEKLDRRGFTMHPVYGYTLTCPEPRCRNGYIADAHHFRLFGDADLYEKYHRLAAEIYLLGEGGLYCPKVDCGEAFIADVDAGQRSRHEANSLDQESVGKKLILCPKCNWAFCYFCRAGASACQCNSFQSPENVLPTTPNSPPSVLDDVKSYVTIKWTTKSCPNCRAPTEKNEGCNHMTCGQCSFDWCWDCEKRWTDDCQWNHWFE